MAKNSFLDMYDPGDVDDISTLVVGQKKKQTATPQKRSSKKKQKNTGNAKRILQSTQTFSPIADIKDGIIITKNMEFVCIVEVSPINFGLMNPDEQDAVVGQFEAALKVLPANVQFKVISRKTNIAERTENLERCFDREENENCRKMQREQIDLIRDVSRKYGVSRRFFVIFKYEPDNIGLKALTEKYNWEDISFQLHRQRTQFEQQMQNCGNKIVSIAYDDAYTLRTLYDILHPYTSETEYVSLDERKIIATKNHLGDDGKYFSCNDILAYDIISTKTPNYISADGIYYATAYITSDGYANNVYAGWMSKLINLGEGIDVDLFLNKADKNVARQKLQYALRFNAMNDKELDSTSVEKDALMRKIQSGYYLKSKLSSSTDEFCYISVLITATARTEEEIKDLITKLKRYCKGINVPIKFCTFEQEEAFLSTFPVCSLSKNLFRKSKRNLMMSDSVSAYPFVSFELSDPDGILYGTNLNNNSLAIVDNFYSDKYPNGNMTICGTSGAGKTYAMSCLCMRMREQGTQVFIISPVKGFEFLRCSAGVGGQYICISPGSKDNINVMEIRKRDNAATIALDGREESQLVKKIQSMHTFFSLLSPLDAIEDQILDDALVRTYQKFGISEDNKSLWDPDNPGHYKRMPILGDLYQTLEEMGSKGENLHTILSRFVVGSASSFNAPTNVNLENKFISLDISYASDDMKALCMFIATDFVWDRCQEDRTRKKVIALDEVWQLIGTSASAQVAQFVLNIFKLIRGYGGIAIAATQDISDFFSKTNGDYGKAIVNSSEIKLILKLKKQEAEFTRSVISMTDNDVDRITNKFQRGDALLMAGVNNVYIHVAASPTEHRIITTKRSDLEAIAAEREREFSRSSLPSYND